MITKGDPIQSPYIQVMVNSVLLAVETLADDSCLTARLYTVKLIKYAHGFVFIFFMVTLSVLLDSYDQFPILRNHFRGVVPEASIEGRDK